VFIHLKPSCITDQLRDDSRALLAGFIADWVVLTLGKVRSGRKLEAQDLEKVENALEFLGKVESGGKRLYGGLQFPYDQEAIQFFLWALRVWLNLGIEVPATIEEVEQKCTSYRGTLEVLKSPNPPTNALEELSGFFREMQRLTLALVPVANI